MKILSDLKSYRALRKSTKLERQALIKSGFFIYTRKRPAIRKAKALTKQFRVVYWVVKESIGYYVVNTADIHRLNVNEKKKPGGIKIRTRDMDKTCVWRSPFFKIL